MAKEKNSCLRAAIGGFVIWATGTYALISAVEYDAVYEEIASGTTRRQIESSIDQGPLTRRFVHELLTPAREIAYYEYKNSKR